MAEVIIDMDSRVQSIIEHRAHTVFLYRKLIKNNRDTVCVVQQKETKQ